MLAFEYSIAGVSSVPMKRAMFVPPIALVLPMRMEFILMPLLPSAFLSVAVPMTSKVFVPPLWLEP